jgi:hypothetical protein
LNEAAAGLAAIYGRSCWALADGRGFARQLGAARIDRRKPVMRAFKADVARDQSEPH